MPEKITKEIVFMKNEVFERECLLAVVCACMRACMCLPPIYQHTCICKLLPFRHTQYNFCARSHVRQFYQISLAICFGLFSSWHVRCECPTVPSVGMFIHYCILCVPFVFADFVWSVLHQFLQPVLYVPARPRNGHIWPGTVAATFAWLLACCLLVSMVTHSQSCCMASPLCKIRTCSVDAVPNLGNEYLWHGFTFVLFKTLYINL